MTIPPVKPIIFFILIIMFAKGIAQNTHFKMFFLIVFICFKITRSYLTTLHCFCDSGKQLSQESLVIFLLWFSSKMNSRVFSRISRHLFLEHVNPLDGLLLLNSPGGLIL